MKHVNLDKLSKIFPKAYFDCAVGCAEPGYDDKPVLLANWNHVPNVVFDRLEALGYACEWYDAWATCSECGKAVRTSPNSYSWQKAYWDTEDVEFVKEWDCQYLIFGKEVGKKCGTPHLQGYVYFTNAKSRKTVRTKYGKLRSHWKVAKGTAGS